MLVFQKLEGKTTTLMFWNQKLEGKTTTPKNCVLTSFLHERSRIFFPVFSLVRFWILLRNDICHHTFVENIVNSVSYSILSSIPKDQNLQVIERSPCLNSWKTQFLLLGQKSFWSLNKFLDDYQKWSVHLSRGPWLALNKKIAWTLDQNIDHQFASGKSSHYHCFGPRFALTLDSWKKVLALKSTHSTYLTYAILESGFVRSKNGEFFCVGRCTVPSVPLHIYLLFWFLWRKYTTIFVFPLQIETVKPKSATVKLSFYDHL